MTKIKLCGLSRDCDIEAANALRPDYIGFVFAVKSRRYVPPETAAELKQLLIPEIRAVGVFVDEAPERVARLLNDGVIDLAQLHGSEDEGYIRRLRNLTDGLLIQAFRIRTEKDLRRAEMSTVFDWTLLQGAERRYFLAGGLNPENVRDAIRSVGPYGVDVSSGIETDSRKDQEKMAAFVAAVREENRQ